MKNAMFMGFLFGAMAVNGHGNDGIFAFKIGQFEVFTLIESERAGNAGILVGADTDVLNRYIPAEGFRSSANAFLIKAAGLNILIDTGMGTGNIIVDKIRSLGVAPENIDAVLITHLHGDHFGSLQRNGSAVFPNAKIYISERELNYFTKTNVNQNAAAALAPYSSQIVSFEPEGFDRGQEILPGITPVAAYGHTPGHTVYIIENGGEKLLVIGDLLHVAPVQFPVPDINATYDMDAAASAAMRKMVLEYAAKNRMFVGGMHIAYPGIGTIEADGSGFKFTPR